MAVKIPWKSLSKGDSLFSKWGPISTKWGTFSAKQVAFFAAVGLVIVVGVALRAGQYFGEPDAAQNAPAVVPAPATPDGASPTPTAATPSAPSAAIPSAPPTDTAPAAAPTESVATPHPPAPQTAPAPETATAPSQQPEQPGAAVETGQAEFPDAGTILVSRKSIEVLSGPSTTASVMYGFPAGRQFRVIGREGGFAQIKDVVSGASGWVNEAALAPPPREPDVYAPSPSRPSSGTRAAADPKPKATKRDGPVTGFEAPAEPAEPRKRPGLFGGGGPFRGIFGGGN